MTNEHITTPDDLLTQVDELEKQRAEHLAQAQRIYDVLAALRKRLASTPGARAGKNARSGRRRRAAGYTDLRTGESGTLPALHD